MSRTARGVAVLMILFFSGFGAGYAQESAGPGGSIVEEKIIPIGAGERGELDSLITDMEADKEGTTFSTVESYIKYMPSREADAMDGKVGITESDAEYSYDIKAFGKMPLELSLETRYIGIDNSTGVKLPAHLTKMAAGFEATLPFFGVDNTYLRIGGYPSFYGDNWTFEASDFYMPARTYIIYKPRDNLIFICGVAVFPQFRDSVWPILGLIYKPNDRLSFNLTPDRPNISYALTEKLDIFAMVDAYYGEFKVDKDGRSDTSLMYKEKFAGSGLSYKLGSSAKLFFTGGGVFGRTLKYRDSLGKVNVKNGGFVELRAEIKI